MPTRWLLPLEFSTTPTPTLEGVHGLACEILDRNGGHYSKTKDWSVRRPSVSGRRIELTIATTSAHSAAQLASLPEGMQVRLGQAFGTLTRGPRPIEWSMWPELLDTPARSRVTVDFLTPTTFRRGQHFHPLPAPHALLTGLIDAWDRLSQVPSGVNERDVWVCQIAGESVTIDSSRRQPNGERKPITINAFVGSVELRADGDSAAGLHRVLRLGEYTGVGAWTTWGLGSIKVRHNNGSR